VTSSAALVHEGRPLVPHDLWSAWSFEPGVVVALAVTAWLYFSGVRALWRAAGRGHGLRSWEAASFLAGWLTLAVTLLSPLHRLGGALFSAHMAQHELLIVLAAPLLVLGRPLIAFVWALPLPWRKSVGRWASIRSVQSVWVFVSLPVVAWILHAAAIWIWHAPPLFQATLQSETVHAAQHLSFLVTGLLFWWALLHGTENRQGRVAGVLYLFTTAVHTNLLGALLVFSNRVWYPIYDASTAPWGLTPLEDQQLAGLIMWIPAGIAYLMAALALAGSVLREPAARSAIGQRRLSPYL
jgi:putative membrane protein